MLRGMLAAGACEDMRICFVIGTVKFSGAEKVLTALATYLSQLGHDVHVVVTLPTDAPEIEPSFKLHSVVVSGVRPLRIIARTVRLRRTIDTIAPDVTISFGYGTNISCVPAFLANGIPHVICERNNPVYDPPGWKPHWLRRLIYPFASAFVFQTETIRNLFPPSIRRRSAVIPNPVIDTYDSVRAEHNHGHQLSIVTLGRLSERDKNQSLLIKAFALLTAEFPTWTLELYGEGPDRVLLEALIRALGLEKRIRLCGQVEHPAAALRRAEIFALPSRTEGMPNALIEAMAAGIACVATDCSGGGASALIVHEANGLIAPNDDLDALAEMLRRLMLDADLRQLLGGAARNVRVTHSMDRIGHQWLEMIRAQVS